MYRDPLADAPWPKKGDPVSSKQVTDVINNLALFWELFGSLQIYNVKDSQFAGGAIGDGTADDSAALLAANAAAHATGGIVVWPGGAYRSAADLEITQQNVHHVGMGSANSVLLPVGNVTGLRVHQTAAWTTLGQWGTVKGLGINGAFAGPSAVGLHYGDSFNGSLTDMVIQDFTGPSAFGMLCDNETNYTEGLIWDRVLFSNNTFSLVYSTSAPGQSSFGYHRMNRCRFIVNPGQVGITVANGALLYNSRLDIIANLGASSSNPPTLMTINNGYVQADELCVQAEANTGGATGIVLSNSGRITGHGLVDLGPNTTSSAPAGTTFGVAGWVNAPGIVAQTGVEGAPSFGHLYAPTLSVGGPLATSATAGTSGAIPGPPAGWLIVEVNGVQVKQPFWNV